MTVTDSLKVGTFLRHSVFLCCWLWLIIVPSVDMLTQGLSSNMKSNIVQEAYHCCPSGHLYHSYKVNPAPRGFLQQRREDTPLSLGRQTGHPAPPGGQWLTEAKTVVRYVGIIGLSRARLLGTYLLIILKVICKGISQNLWKVVSSC